MQKITNKSDAILKRELLPCVSKLTNYTDLAQEATNTPLIVACASSHVEMQTVSETGARSTNISTPFVAVQLRKSTSENSKSRVCRV